MFLYDIIKKLSENKVINFIQLIIASIILGITSLYFAAEFLGMEIFESYFENNLIVFLNILPCVLLTLILWFITSRAAISFTLSSILVMGLTLSSWFKLQFRNDPVMFIDIFLIKEATNMSKKYKLFVTKEMIIALVVIIAVILFLSFFARGRLGFQSRIVGLVILFLSLVPLKFLYMNDNIYLKETKNIEHINEWSSTEVYISKGFVYPFIYSIKTSIQKPPPEYNAKDAENMINIYKDADIPQNKKVDIVGIMLEAYADFSIYDNIKFETDPYEYYHKLEKESISGNLYTNIFAGGTINTERAFLTGYCNQGSFRAKTNSYPWYFKEQGYTVTGSHPSYDWFYNRANINENLGFDDYKFMSNYYKKFTDKEVAMDNILMSEIYNLHKEHKEKSNKPYFSFNVSYQGHGPYGSEKNYYANRFVKSGIFSSETENILNNYFGSIYDTNQHLEKLVNNYKKSKDPVILVLFGDHKPWLGDNSSVYEEVGISLNYMSSDEGFKNYYGTRYLIWANDAAKKVLGNKFVGKGPDIGPYFLMNYLFEQCGWKGPAYMQAINKVSKELPVISVSGLYMQDGKITNKLKDENVMLSYVYRCMEYYEQNNFRYNKFKDEKS